MSLTQLSALSSLDEHGPMTPGGLAAKERVQPPSMTRVIASLADAGMVSRTPHPTDGRQIIVALTDSGQALLADETSAREKWMIDQLAGLDADQLAVLRESIDIIVGFVNSTE